MWIENKHFFTSSLKRHERENPSCGLKFWVHFFCCHWWEKGAHNLCSFFKLPFSTTHGTMCLSRLRIHPLQNTMKMKCMVASTPYCKESKTNNCQSIISERGPDTTKVMSILSTKNLWTHSIYQKIKCHCSPFMYIYIGQPLPPHFQNPSTFLNLEFD